LSLLLFHPVRPIELVILEEDREGYKHLDMLITMPGLNKKTISSLMQGQIHQWMPITPDTVSLPKTFKNWIKFSNGYYANGYDVFTADIANDFGVYHEHSVRADFVMLLTQLEQITKEHKMKPSEKYNYPISLYDKSTVLQVIKKALCFDQSVENVGVRLAELRGEVAHIGRPMGELARAKWNIFAGATTTRWLVKFRNGSALRAFEQRSFEKCSRTCEGYKLATVRNL
jgi:hypothetical protein